jgi:CBS domain-containing protein
MWNHSVSEVLENRKFVSVSGDTCVRRVAELMAKDHVGAVMVTDKRAQHLKGICTERDIVFGVVAAGLDPATVKVEAVMNATPQTISPEKPFGHALHMMYEGGFHHVPVVQNGHPVGILSARDALCLDACQFEEELVRREEITTIL